MSINWVASRAHRALGALKQYRAADSSDCERIGIMPLLDPAEEVIGIYKNPEGTSLDLIAITTKRLFLLYLGSSWTHVSYNSIHSISLCNGDKKLRILRIDSHDGIVRDIEVAGGEGKYRDCMEFLRFMDRILLDLKKQ